MWHGYNYALELYRKLGKAERGGVRIGPVHYNTAAEVDRTLVCLDKLLRAG